MFFQRSKSILFFLIVFLLLVYCSGCVPFWQGQNSSAPEVKKAPGFSLQEIESRQTINFPSHFQGRKVALAFFSVECEACVEEVLQLQPRLKSWQQKNFSLLIISSDPEDVIRDFVTRNDIEATVLLDPELEAYKTYKVLLPSISLVNEKGEIDKTLVGWKGKPSLKEIDKWITVNSFPDGGIKPSEKRTINLVATGDILMHNTVIASGKKGSSFSFDHLFLPVKDLIDQGDYALINLESALAGPQNGYTGYPQFNSPDSVATALKDSGFDLVITANNHIMDRGYQGALRTMDVLRDAGLDTAGTFKTAEEREAALIKDINGIKVAYLAYSYDTNGIPLPKDKPYFYNLLEREQMLADIEVIRPQVDLLVLVLHWGVEYSPFPTEQQQKLTRDLFEKGADVILGGHPHVIQPMEIMNIGGKKKFIIYSMGNSIGNQRGVERNSGVILNLQFTKDMAQGETSLIKVSYTPTFSHSYYVNGKQMFRVVPVEKTIKAIQEGKEPYLKTSDLPLLEQVLTATNNKLNELLGSPPDPVFKL